MLAMVAAMLLTLTLAGQTKKYGLALSESFENGLPDTWTQEFVRGNHAWTVEEGDAYPDGAADGAKRIALRNGTSQTIGYITRLVTPVMNLDTIYEPILTFAYATDKWAGDFDTLKIFYRTSADMEWVEYVDHPLDRYRSGWTRDTLRLNAPNGTYQLAFQGSDNMGRGIVLDDIQVRSTPNCQKPSGMGTSALANDSAVVYWNAMFDAVQFHVKISTTALSAVELNTETAKADVMDTIVPASVRELTLRGLTPGTEYYAYVVSLCKDEQSEWSDQFVFKTTNLMEIPYYEGFNLDYVPGAVYYVTNVNWDFYTNTGYAVPFINTATEDIDLYKFSRDNTRSLFFSDGNGTGSCLDAGDYGYAVLPELRPEYKITDLQISFYGGYDDCTAHGKLIIGVMENPEDMATFTAVDTVYGERPSRIDEYIVPLDKYTGKGRFITIMSNFEEDNHFFIDDVRVDSIPPCAKAQDIEFGLPSATELKLSWRGTQEGEVLISAMEIKPEEITDATQGALRQTVTTNPAVVTGLTPWQTGYVYIRNKCGDTYGAWSNPIFIRMPEKITALPDTMDFEDESTLYNPGIDDGGGINDQNQLCRGILDIIDIEGGYTMYPVTYDVSYEYRLRSDSYRAFWFNNGEAGQVITAIFPYMDMDLKEMRIAFYTRYYVNYESRAGFVVGVMSDATDLTTFVPVDTVEGVGPVWEKHIVSFDKYEGEGHFVAFMSVNDGGVYCDNSSWTEYNGLYIDDLVFEEIPDCREPDDIEEEQQDSLIILSWDGYGQKEWQVRLMTESVPVDSLYSETYTGYAKDTVVKDNPTVTLRVEPNGVDYWYSVRAVCDGAESAWTDPLQFTSKCVDVNPIPYYMDFDGYEMGSTVNGFAIPCWYTEQHASYSGGGGQGSTSYYPNIIENGYKSGNGRLQLYESSSVDANYVALPLLAEEDMSKLTLSMKMESGYKNSRLLVGFMDDPYDLTTFDTLTSVYNTVTGEEEVIYVNLAGKEKYGKHLALFVDENAGSTFSQFYIDSLVVDYTPKCGVVQYPKCISSTDEEAELTWQNAGSETAWDVVVTDNNEVTDAVLDEAMTASVLPEHVVAVNKAVAANPFTVTGLLPNGSYYFYVRANCGEDGHGQWSGVSEMFTTKCLAMNPGDESLQTFEEDAPLNCWIVGSVTGANPPAITTKSTPTSTNYAHSGTKALKFYNTSAQTIYAIAPLIDVDSVKNLEVSFWAGGGTYAERPSSYSNLLQVGVLTSEEDLASFEKIGDVEAYVDGQPYTISLDEYVSDYNGNVGRYIMFLSSDYAQSNGISIDDVRFDLIVDCPAPVNVTADEITDNAAKIAWRGRAEGQTYELKWAIRQLTQEELDGTVAVENVEVGSTTANTNEAEITGLKPSTRHYVYVRAVQGGDKSVWSAPIRFYTECPAAYGVPYEEDFEPYREKFDSTSIREYATSMPDCWTAYYVGSTSLSYPTPNEDEGVDESWCLYVYAASKYQSYAALPKIESNKERHILAFSVIGSSTTAQRSVIVGMSSDISSETSIVNTFTPIDTFLLNSDSYERYFVPLEKLDGYIVFTTSYEHNLSSSGSSTTGGYYLDDVEVYETPSCPRPEYFEIAGYDDNSISLEFTEMGGATQWEVRWTEAGGSLDAATAKVYDSITPEITDLTPLTAYDVYVRAVCSETEQSEWNGPLTCTTMALPVTEYPYNMDFEDDKTDFSNWVLLQDGCTDKWYRGLGYNYPEGEATKQLFISCDGGTTATYDKENSTKSYSWAYRRLRLEPGKYTFDFDWACDGYSSSNYLKAGLLPIDAKFDATSDEVIQGDGLKENLTYSNDVPDWISLEDTLKSNGDPLGRLYDAEENWRHCTMSVVITDELAGDYNLIFFWRKSSYTKTASYLATPSAVVDNVTVTKNTCLAPIDINTPGLKNDSTGVTWNISGEEPLSYEIFVTANAELTSPDDAQAGDTAFFKDGITEKSIGVYPLASSTTYYLFMRTECEEGRYSDWSDPYVFETSCDPYAVPVTFGFEAEDLHDGLSSSYKVPNCFMQSPGITSGAHAPYAVKNTSSRKGSRNPENGSEYSLYFTYSKNNQASCQGRYIVFPLMDADLDSLQIRFWMRAAYTNSRGVLNIYNGSNYDVTLTIGTMTDPADPSTFHKIQTVSYPYDNTQLSGSNIPETADPTGNKYWAEIKVPLKGAVGQYIAMRNDTTDTEYKYVYVDDVTIEPFEACMNPYDVQVSAITTESATLSFRHVDGEKWAVHISTRTDMGDTVRIDTVTDAEAALLENLAENTQYSVRVRQICSESDFSEWSDVATFNTPADLRFYEGFSVLRTYPVNWLTSIQGAEAVFGGEALKHRAEGGYWDYVGATAYATSHQSMSLSSYNTERSWLVTPAIALEGEEKVQLTFDLALTAVGSAASIPENYRGATDKYFMVVVSADGGSTWKQEDIVGLWANEGFAKYTADHVLDDVPATGMKYRIDLSEYAGKTVRVGFYAESLNDKVAEYDIHLDNVQVNSYVVETPKESVCQTCDYESELITVLSEDLEVGDNVYEILDVSDDDSPDVNCTLTLTVLPMAETVIEDSVCAGDTYTKHGFNTSLGGINKIKLPSANQCDSVVVLDLKLIPTVYTTVDTTICQGQHVEWNGKEYDRTTVVTDTLERADCGCDSIVTFVLDVTPAVEYPLNVTICHDETYPFAGEELDSTGTYRGVFETATGCDSIVNLTLTVLPDYRSTIHDVLCEGEKYNKHGFTGVVGAGPHTLPLKSVDGCDSTVTLYLTILNGDTTYVEETVTTDELPYEYMDLYYGEDTEPGTYTDTLTVDGGEGGCESVIIHTLTVEETTWWQGTSRKELMLTPNPVRIHESVRVHLELTAAEREGLTVQVYSNSGALIRQYEPEGEPVTVDGLDAAGVYVVRIVDGLGNVYTGKIIVR